MSTIKEDEYAIVKKGKTPRRGTRVLVKNIEDDKAWCKAGDKGYMWIELERLTSQKYKTTSITN